MRRLRLAGLVALVVCLGVLAVPAQAAGEKSGGPCSIAGNRIRTHGVVLVCVKKGARKVWVVDQGGSTSPGTAGPGGGSESVSTAGLPSITSFRTAGSDRLPVDMSTTAGTAPFYGTDSETPHPGVHVLWSNLTGRWTAAGGSHVVTAYPALYAVADGVVARIDPSKQVGPNQAYEVDLAIAKDSAGRVFMVSYGLEPFAQEPSRGFYESFIKVKVGQKVKKGAILAYMYVPPDSTGSTHMHLHLQVMSSSGGFLSPSIFAPQAVAQFAAGYATRDGQATGVTVPACIGWKVSAAENPYGTGAATCL